MENQQNKLEQDFIKKQKEICIKYNAVFCPVPFNKFVGVSLKSLELFNMPINGLRHPTESEQSENWFIWAGEYLDSVDFFQPIHTYHLIEICPKVINYLGLAPGWRFLFDNTYEDVWYDKALLHI